jgi:hypothetical protein
VAQQLSVLPKEIQNIQAAIIRRAMLGYYAHRWPQLMHDYTIVSAEGAWNWLPAPDVMIPFRMDRLMRANDNNHLVIHDFKFIGSMDLNWRQRHQFSDQTMMYVQALKERSNEPVDGIIYDAIILGKWDSKNNRQKSPLVTGYATKDGDVEPSYIRNAPVVDLTEWDDDKWLRWAQRWDVFSEMYATSGLINPLGEDLERTQISLVAKQRDWDYRMQQLKDASEQWGEESQEYQRLFAQLVEKNPDACLQYGWERACEHYDLCWVTRSTDGYVPREDHHPIVEETKGSIDG